MDPLVKRPLIAFIGYTDTRANLITALGDRNSEFSSFIPVHGSLTPAFEIGASFAGMWARHHAGDRVGRPVVGNVLPGVLAADANELTYGVRDSGIKAGASWTRNIGSRVAAGDTATTRTETDQGVATDSYRFAVIIPNLQYKINAADITFGSSPFVQAVVISDDVAAAPAFAVRPKTAKAYAIQLVDDWVERGLTADRDQVVEGIVAEIHPTNAGRINVLIPDIPSAGLRILAAKIEWDFLV
jgi:phage tail sheath gpL-like